MAGGAHEVFTLSSKACESGDDVGGVGLGDSQPGEGDDVGEDGETHIDGWCSGWKGWDGGKDELVGSTGDGELVHIPLAARGGIGISALSRAKKLG